MHFRAFFFALENPFSIIAFARERFGDILDNIVQGFQKNGISPTRPSWNVARKENRKPMGILLIFAKTKEFNPVPNEYDGQKGKASPDLFLPFGLNW